MIDEEIHVFVILCLWTFEVLTIEAVKSRILRQFFTLNSLPIAELCEKLNIHPFLGNNILKAVMAEG